MLKPINAHTAKEMDTSNYVLVDLRLVRAVLDQGENNQQ
jgi:hypothetical protein